MRSPIYLMMFALFVVSSSGCATVLLGTTQMVPVTSTPSGATVYVDGQLVGKTPLNAKLSRGDNHTLTFELQGYESTSASTSKKISGLIFGNILLGGIIGLAVDFGTGAAYNVAPEAINVFLQKKSAALKPHDYGSELAELVSAAQERLRKPYRRE